MILMMRVCVIALVSLHLRSYASEVSLKNNLNDLLKVKKHECLTREGDIDCTGLFEQTCTDDKNAREIFYDKMESLFPEMILKSDFGKNICFFVDDNLEAKADCSKFKVEKLNETMKKHNLNSCDKLYEYMTEKIDEDIALVVGENCYHSLNAFSAKSIPQKEIVKAEKVLERLKKDFASFLEQSDLTPVNEIIQKVTIVSEFRASSFVNGVRDTHAICGGKNAISAKACKDYDEGNSATSHFCPGGKIYLNESELEFSMAHELAHLILNQRPHLVSKEVSELIEKDETARKLIKNSTSTVGNNIGKEYNEMSADILAIKILKTFSKQKKLQEYLPYFCSLHSSRGDSSEYYKEKVLYLHPKDRMESLFCKHAF